MSDGTLLQWITSAAPPMYALALGCAILAVRFWPLWKQRLTEARTAEDAIVGNQWRRFQEEIDRLAARVARLEQDVEDCHRERDEERRGRLEAEAILMGQGKARQEAAEIVARERANGDKP